MNPRLDTLHDYPFARLARLMAAASAPEGMSTIAWSVGEPKHPAPAIVLDAIREHLDALSVYPSTKGLLGLREAISAWLHRRFNLAAAPDPEREILPVSGTREALFSIAQAVVPQEKAGKQPVVVMPNPFYQIYEGAALLAGAEPYYVNTTAETGYKMDLASIPEEILERTALVYVCSPGNPTGAVMNEADYKAALELAERYDFILASDECYSEIYFDEATPPVGLLEIADRLGLKDYHRCLVFHSLSKRSNLPGLRSGFVAGDASIMAPYMKYRTYHGATLSDTAQLGSIAAWGDEAHVEQNRAAYARKFDAVLDIFDGMAGLSVYRPEAGFYLWGELTDARLGSDEDFTRALFEATGVKVLPGSYLSRTAHGANPGTNYIRMALVAEVDECTEAARRVRTFIESRL